MNVLAEVARMVDAAFAQREFLATVQGTTGEQVTVRRLGQSTNEGPYPAADGLAAAVSVGSIVIVKRIGATHVVTTWVKT